MERDCIEVKSSLRSNVRNEDGRPQYTPSIACIPGSYMNIEYLLIYYLQFQIVLLLLNCCRGMHG